MNLCEEKEEGWAEEDARCNTSTSGKRPNLNDGAVTSDPLSGRRVKETQFEASTLQIKECEGEERVPMEKTEDLQTVKEKHKTFMKNKYENLFEGIKRQENQTPLNRIYTEVYIIEGETEGFYAEHEVLHMEKTPKTQHAQDNSIYCNDIFKPQSHQGKKIKSVLTKGIAGIGKTISVQKFILDWAEGTANQDVDFMFVLSFRELNLIRDDHFSLHKLLLEFHPQLQHLDSKIYEECKVVFIFDGLDESRMDLMFSNCRKVCDVTETSSLSLLMSNLMKGDLLPSALIWITSRPAAANQIPSKYITRVTEIQGFSDAQIEEYFRKRIINEHQASRIMSHIKRVKSLHIMCHIPVFCWISSTVLQNILEEEIPKTLTEMYIHFLLIQMKMKNEKYDPDRVLEKEVIVKLSELAFKQLMKGNVMFYEEDLRECGIDITDASVYSGICTEIFKEEFVIHQRKIYSFIHLSFQEFLAAFFVFYSYLEKNMESLGLILDKRVKWRTGNGLPELLKSVTEESLKTGDGCLDLFLRFLLGISLESNKRLLQDLLTHTENISDTIQKTTQYIKKKIRTEHLSANRSINLFLCLLEMKDQTLYREIQMFVKEKKFSMYKLSLSHCAAIAHMLQMSEDVLDELDLDKFNTSSDGILILIPALMNCRKARLCKFILTDKCCESLAYILQSSNTLKELDISYSCFQDSGVKLIFDGLKGSHCQLNSLKIVGCHLTEECCESLASVLESSNSLRDLDLTNNSLQDSGVNLISDGLKSSHCDINTLRLPGCDLTDKCCESLASVLQSSNSLRDLDLSHNHLKDSGVKLISDALKSSHCHLNTLRFVGCDLTEEGYEYLASVLQSSNSLRDLDLSINHPKHLGVKLICDGLKSSHCHLEILKLKGCDLTEECCESLASVLQSSNSLRDLDLGFNDIKDSGLMLISDGLKSSHCQLNALRLSLCKLGIQSCGYLASALRSNPSHLIELDLKNNNLGSSGFQMLTDLKHDPKYALNTIHFI